MKQKKIVIIMAGILAAAAAMTGCAEQNKTATQIGRASCRERV